MTGFKKVSLSNVHLGVDQKVKRRPEARRRPDDRVRRDPGRDPAAPDLQLRPERDRRRGADQDASPERPELRQPHPHHPGRPARRPRARTSTARAAWPGAPRAGFSANGQRPRDNNYLLDGVDNNETWLQTVVVFPSVDALDEFKMQTSTYSAEFGTLAGRRGQPPDQVGDATSSTAASFEFHRNDAFDANNFFNNRAGRAKPDFKQNQFGATLGGPIIKDKTFFFADYQGLRINQGQTYRLDRAHATRCATGDFSEINRVIYDPLTGQPFPGNIIPANRFDPASANVLDQLYPAANTAGHARRPTARPSTTT